MNRIRALIACLCAALMAAPALPAQQPGAGGSLGSPSWHSGLTHPYTAKEVPPISLANTNRLDMLLRGGRLYLSLQDSIALALENNLDIEIQRYATRIAEANLLRAQAGGGARGVSTSLSSGSTATSAGGGVSTGNTSVASQGSGGSTGTGGQLSFDPTFQSTLGWGHRTTPTTNSFITGTNSVVNTNKQFDFSISKGFISGATSTLGITNAATFSNSGRNDFNPATQSALTLTVAQPLLRGFGFAYNTSGIKIAKNNIQVADLTFRRQVIDTVASVIGLYWDLVSFNEGVRVSRQALAVSEKLYNDNKKQVEIGTLAPIEVVRAEAEVAARQQDVLVAETRVLQQETILKNALSRTGTASPALSEARIVPTDRIRIPETEAVEPVQDLVTRALDNRPELAQVRIQLDNSRINVKTSKNLLKPEIDAFTQLRNNALAGQINGLPIPTTPGQPALARNPNAVDPFFLGGYSTVLGQLFGRNFPDYTVGVQLTIPIRNRAAQSDMINAQLNLRQAELQQQQLINQVRVDVQNALIALQQAHAQFQAAVKNRILQEQTVDAEQKKYALGASTIFQVIFAQRDLATAQAAEVTALTTYARARTALDRSTGMTLANNNVQIDEAEKGQVSTPPTPPPVIEQQPPPQGQGK